MTSLQVSLETLNRRARRHLQTVISARRLFVKLISLDQYLVDFLYKGQKGDERRGGQRVTGYEI